ncbi:MAG TPA: aldo/keto reductase, partial [Trichocoleus sp.]
GELYAQAQKALDQLRPIAAKYQTTLGNLALAWLMAQPQTCPIVGARNAQQAKENAQAAAVELSEADLAEMDTISRSVTQHLDADPIMWNFAA